MRLAQDIEVVRNILRDEINNAKVAPRSEYPVWLTVDQAQMLYMASEPPKFINCGTVCVSLLPVVEGLAVIRRGNPNEDGFGKLGLIGGFQEGKISEPLKTAACREMKEEIGLEISESQLTLINAVTDDYHHNVIFYEVEHKKVPTFAELQKKVTLDLSEVSELVLLTDTPSPDEMAFIFHYNEIKTYFDARSKIYTEFD